MTRVNCNTGHLNPPHLLYILRQTPNLVDYFVDIMIGRLENSERGIPPAHGTRLLRRLSLPSLEVLSIATSSDVLLSFLRRSGPPLLELTLRIRRGAIDFVTLAECAPNLSRFESLLPHLDTLVVHLDRHYLPENGDAFWPTLVRTLASRRTHIHVFQLTTLGRLRASQLPPLRIRAAIRELVTDGMQVSISMAEGRWTSELGSDTD
ncbi:hypothetical protein C8R45DRAFT_393244 [Mycena sanguinolenta]|nr:hypothetical protein C8R45DRAFT_393244 [Mycena sanguinolenta]